MYLSNAKPPHDTMLPFHPNQLQSAWGLEDQFAKFTAIFDEYLKPTSPQEINISSSMQRSLAACHERQVFFSCCFFGRFYATEWHGMILASDAPDILDRTSYT